jgi:DUF1680 family protein
LTVPVGTRIVEARFDFPNCVRYFGRWRVEPVTDQPLTRRTLLGASAAGLAAAAVTPVPAGAAAAPAAVPAAAAAPAAVPAAAAAPAAVPAAARTDIGVSAFAFPLTAVTLLDGPFRANMLRTLSYLTFVDPDRLLHTFRLNVGLASSATPCGGWETPTTELRGHSTGHLLTALAQAFANTGDASFKTKGDSIVSVLATCQSRAATAGFNTGYVSAYPESMIDTLEAGRTVWAPYYTLHKIMAGLLDMYLLTGNTQALDVLTRKAAWVKFRMDRLTLAQQQNVLRVEFGGMGEVLTNLYQVTGDPNHLATARVFDHAQIFDPLASNVDQLNGFHANTQIPKIIAAIREYHATGTTRYRDIATNFWNIVIGHHTYVIGGNSNGEFFKAPDRIASELSDTTCETCNTYNMLKLSRQLFFTDPTRNAYLDYYERGLFDQILGQQNPASAHGFVAYYQPLRAGGIKTYSNDYNNFTCDHGTGMESHTKFADSIYFSSGDTLYVNLFIASVLNWAAKGVTIRQDTTFPQTATTRLTVTGSGTFTMKVRIPAWTSGAELRVNGAVQSVPVTPGTFATLSRTWASGDVVDLTLPMSLTREATPDNPTVQAVKFGPVVLAGGYGTTNLTALPTLDPDSVRATGTPLQFTATANGSSVTLIPFYNMHGQRYTVYWSVGNLPPLPAFVASYPFDDGSGTTAVDATGNGKNASLAGGAGWTTGRTGGAVNLTGSGAHVAVPASILAGATSFSIATWVRPTTIAAWSRIFDFGSGTTSYMFLTPRSGSGALRFAITTSGAGGEQQLNGPSALTAGTWTHVAVTQTGNLGILYVNGVEVARNANLTIRPGNLGGTTQNWIGRSQYGNDPFLTGAVDGFRIYSRALSASEVNALFTGGQ